MQIGPYRVEGELGSGGMGMVYAAYDAVLDRPVAIKVVRPHVAWGRVELERFRREGQALARLRHPGVVGVLSVGEEQGSPYLVMDRLPGPSLGALLEERGAVAPSQAAAWCERLAVALTEVHREGLLHRDLKPDNVLLDRRGQPVLTDFGLVRVGEGSPLSQTGEAIGTPGYMAPEQADGRPRDQGPATDVYGLGATLFALLAGRAPFRARTALATLDEVLHVPAPDVRSLRPQVPGALAEVVARCLEKSPEARYPDMESLRRDLVAFLEPVRATQPARRGGWAGALAGALVGLGVGSWVGGGGEASVAGVAPPEVREGVRAEVREEASGGVAEVRPGGGSVLALGEARDRLVYLAAGLVLDRRSLELQEVVYRAGLSWGIDDQGFRAVTDVYRGAFADAEERLTLWLSEHPEDVPARLLRAGVRGQLGRWEESLEDFEAGAGVAEAGGLPALGSWTARVELGRAEGLEEGCRELLASGMPVTVGLIRLVLKNAKRSGWAGVVRWDRQQSSAVRNTVFVRSRVTEAALEFARWEEALANAEEALHRLHSAPWLQARELEELLVMRAWALVGLGEREAARRDQALLLQLAPEWEPVRELVRELSR